MKRYIAFDPKGGFPAGRNISYECVKCGAEIPSMPKATDPDSCTCGNVRVDMDGARASVADPAKLKAFRSRPMVTILSRTDFDVLLEETLVATELLVARGGRSQSLAESTQTELQALMRATAKGGAPLLEDKKQYKFGWHTRPWPDDTDVDFLDGLSAIAEYATTRMDPVGW